MEEYPHLKILRIFIALTEHTMFVLLQPMQLDQILSVRMLLLILICLRFQPLLMPETQLLFSMIIQPTAQLHGHGILVMAELPYFKIQHIYI